MAGDICLIAGCGRNVWVKGYCRRHYLRLIRHGDPLAGGPLRDGTKHVTHCSIDGCNRPVAYADSGLCRCHKYRLDTYGNPLGGTKVRSRATPVSQARKGKCIVDGCDRNAYRYSLCRRHHYRLITHGDPAAGGPLRNTEHSITCCVPGCEKPYLAAGMCETHYSRHAKRGDPLYQRVIEQHPCKVRGCTSKTVARGYCGKHYQRLLIHGSAEITSRPDIGRGTVSSGGYRIVFRPGHPNAGRHGRIAEHRLIMAEMMGRPLFPNENVHHKNGNKLDNNPDNLELWIKSQPCGQRVEDILAWSRNALAIYGTDDERRRYSASQQSNTEPTAA
jgi:hypothetical protein